MKIALIYDRVNTWGGAEQVLLALHELFPKAPLYTSLYNPKRASWAKVFPKVIPSFLQKIPILKNHHELLGWLTPLAFETFDFSSFDMVISVTSEAAKGVITKPPTRHICYCLTPTRYLYGDYKKHLEKPSSKLRWIPFYKIISKPFLSYAKYWDQKASNRPDEYISISTAVRQRIKKYYKKGSEIVFPPVDIEKFIPKKRTGKQKNQKGSSGDYYLIVSRLVPYKNIDMAIRAFNNLNKKLIIVGSGSEEKYLKNISNKNITFKGFVEEEELISLYKSAKALIYPQEEDFGITAVEAQASGCPVVAYEEGGVRDTVINKKTGLFFKNKNQKSLINAINEFEKMTFNKLDLINNSRRFSKNVFKGKFLEIINH